MNKCEYLKIIICQDLEKITEIQENIKTKELDMVNEISDLENQIDKLESLKVVDEDLILKKYIEYEKLVKPITDLKSQLTDAKLEVIDHYSLLLAEVGEDTTYVIASKKNLVMMDKIIEGVKNSLKSFAKQMGVNYF